MRTSLRSTIGAGNWNNRWPTAANEAAEPERIGVMAPKRNIGTWIFCLLGNEANEEDDYKNRVSASDIKPSVAVFLKMCPLKIATISLPSLRHACTELTAFIARGG